MALSPGQIVATLAPIVGRVGAAGIAGNLMQESSDDPGRAGGGLAQWQGSRYTGLVKYAQSRGLPATSAQAALGYLVQDLKGPYAGLTNQLRSAKDPGTAATLFSNIYERPGTPMLANRVNYARQALGGAGATAQTLPSLPGVSAPQTSSQTVPTFNQQAYNRANARYIAGSFLSGEKNPFDIGPKGADLGPNPVFSQGGLTTTAPNVADYQGTKVIQAAQAGLQKLAGGTQLHAHPAITASATSSLPKGITQFDGKPVAAWIAPVLAYAQKHGWQGSVTSGYRTLAQQTQIYNSGVRPAAKPGTSNHEMTAFPGGAVDVTQAQQLSQILAKSPYASLLVWAGAKDPPHLSHPHNGAY